MIKNVLEHVDQSSYRALILSDRFANITIDINALYAPQKIDGYHYSGQLRMFRFPSGAMIWVHPTPKNDSQFMRYAGMTFHSIIVEGPIMRNDTAYLKSRLRRDNEMIPLTMYVNDKLV